MLWQYRWFMFYDSRPSDDWTMTIEYETPYEVDSAGAESIALDGAAGLATNLFNNAKVDRCVISTWEPDSDPYDPAALRTVPIGIFGERAFALTDPVADNIVHFMRKNVGSGRAGKIQLRGCILNNQISSAGGEFAFGGGLSDDFQDFANSLFAGLSVNADPVLIGLSLQNTIYPAVAAGEKQVPIKVYSEDPIVRPASSLTSVGPRTRQVTQ